MTQIELLLGSLIFSACIFFIVPLALATLLLGWMIGEKIVTTVRRRK